MLTMQKTAQGTEEKGIDSMIMENEITMETKHARVRLQPTRVETTQQIQKHKGLEFERLMHQAIVKIERKSKYQF